METETETETETEMECTISRIVTSHHAMQKHYTRNRGRFIKIDELSHSPNPKTAKFAAQHILITTSCESWTSDCGKCGSSRKANQSSRITSAGISVFVWRHCRMTKKWN